MEVKFQMHAINLSQNIANTDKWFRFYKLNVDFKDAHHITHITKNKRREENMAIFAKFNMEHTVYSAKFKA